jgi:hypothetical protein
MAGMSQKEQERMIRELLATVMSSVQDPAQMRGVGQTPMQQRGGQTPPQLQMPPAPMQAQPAQAQPAPMQGPGNMNVIKFLNQYANMGEPQQYADQFAGGDLSKLKARTYRDEEGNPYNDYYIKGLLGG